jgi:hypothetical protein
MSSVAPVPLCVLANTDIFAIAATATGTTACTGLQPGVCKEYPVLCIVAAAAAAAAVTAVVRCTAPAHWQLYARLQLLSLLSQAQLTSQMLALMNASIRERHLL